jgi:hypothetical protein
VTSPGFLQLKIFQFLSPISKPLLILGSGDFLVAGPYAALAGGIKGQFPIIT